MLDLLNAASTWAIPVMLVGILLLGYLKRVRVYEAFVAGAAEGFNVAVRAIPYVVGMLVALGVFRDTGALGLVVGALRPVLGALRVPGEILPMAIIRPLSGGGAMAVVADVIRTHGPDSFLGRLASVMMGSTDTTFYILTLYFGSVGVRRARHSAAAGLIGDFFGFAASLLVCRIMFGG